MNMFFEIHRDLPREGPGDNQSTRRAFRKLSRLPEDSAILDLGCGPGAQTLELAALSGNKIFPIDNHQPYLKQLYRKAANLGLLDRIHISNQSMHALAFPAASFDLIWSEGAIFILGFENGLKSLKKYLKPGGTIVISELTWLKDNPPKEIKTYWEKEYPPMKTLDENLSTIYDCGFYVIDYFALPPASWLEEYYEPIEQRLETLRGTYAGNPEFEDLAQREKEEATVFKKYNQWYGYVFYIMELKKD